MVNGIYSAEFNLGGSTKATNEGGPGVLQIVTYNSSTGAYRYPVSFFASGNTSFGGSGTSVLTDSGQAIQVRGTGLFTDLAGTGTRMVVADSSGVLSTQAIPSSISLTTTGDSGAASYNSSTGVLNIPNYTPAVSTNYIAKATSMGVLGSSQIYDNGTSVLINTTSDNGSGAKLQVSGGGTFSGSVGVGMTSAPSGLFEVSNQGAGVTVGDFLVDAANKNVYVGRLSSTSNDNTNFIVRNRIGTELFKVVGNTGAATFSSSVTAANAVFSGTSSEPLRVERIIGSTVYGKYSLAISGAGAFSVYDAIAGNDRFIISSTGAATFSSSVTARNLITSVTNGVTPSLSMTNQTSGLTYSLYAANTAANGFNGLGIYDGTDFRLTLTSSGNLGIGVTPSAWGAGFTALQISNRTALWEASNYTFLTNNAYGDGSVDRYLTTAGASRYYQRDGVHIWSTAPSGTAGNAISFTQAMTLAANGNLTLGTTSSYSGVRLVSESTTGVAAWFITGGDSVPVSLLNNGGSISTIGFKGTSTANAFNVRVGADGENFIAYTSNTERMRITSGGNVGIGTASPSRRLTVANESGAAGIGLGVNMTGTFQTIFFVQNTGSGQNDAWMQLLDNGATTVNIAANNSRGGHTYFNGGGNFGIGTTSPTSISGYTTLDVRGTNGSLLYMGTGSTASLRLIGEGTDAYIDNLTTGGALLFRTNNATERMRITSGGNVGIGVTSPSAKLHVGNAAAGTAAIFTNTNDSDLFINFNTSITTLMNTANAVLAFGTNNTERMRITSGGVIQASNGSFFAGENFVTISALNTDYVIINSVPNGILVVRDNTSGGSGCYLLDPNAGVITIATNVNGILVFTYSNGKWYVKKTSGTVPTSLSWIFLSA